MKIMAISLITCTLSLSVITAVAGQSSTMAAPFQLQCKKGDLGLSCDWNHSKITQYLAAEYISSDEPGTYQLALAKTHFYYKDDTQQQLIGKYGPVTYVYQLLQNGKLDPNQSLEFMTIELPTQNNTGDDAAMVKVDTSNLSWHYHTKFIQDPATGKLTWAHYYDCTPSATVQCPITALPFTQTNTHYDSTLSVINQLTNQSQSISTYAVSSTAGQEWQSSALATTRIAANGVKPVNVAYTDVNAPHLTYFLRFHLDGTCPASPEMFNVQDIIAKVTIINNTTSKTRAVTLSEPGFLCGSKIIMMNFGADCLGNPNSCTITAAQKSGLTATSVKQLFSKPATAIYKSDR